MSMSAAVTAIIPIKALADAKGRLADAVGPAQRQELAAWMFDRVLQACLGCAAVERVIVVAGDETAASLVPAGGATVICEREPGLDRAISCASELLFPGAASLVVAADLPLADADALEQLCARAAMGGVVVAPTSDGGTGALLRSPADVIPTAFGSGSADAHLDLARRAGVACWRLELPALALDVDTRIDLAEARSRHAPLDAWMRAHDVRFGA